ncbi:hypothetical protein [Stagnihabitans tardus]|uniref:DUF2946 domain-containing protein n=1 Tax=Stagnihabitans tardus TaxID=2699202 RepID=A0AAE4Y9K6_9RHOB|nr:hypothetical protein [Stagnihabitans tardus]NBZ88501.1 hypothetical protein [Stagnihabitans tardus]
MRLILALFLSALLALASVTEAVARSEMAGASAQELCGTGTILIDATGKPLQAQPCTHCLAASVTATLVSAPALARPLTRAARLPPEATSPALSQPLPPAQARGPPALL